MKPSGLCLLHKFRPCLNVYLTNFVPTELLIVIRCCNSGTLKYQNEND